MAAHTAQRFVFHGALLFLLGALTGAGHTGPVRGVVRNVRSWDPGVGSDFSQIPIVDVAALIGGAGDRRSVADAIGRAWRDCGFFYGVGHGVDATLQARIEAPPVPGSFVRNLGDMLDRMTGGLYRSTPHRVRNAAQRDRLSFRFFFDPNWKAEVGPIPGCAPTRDDKSERWDGARVHEWRVTYGDYLLAKVSQVFPALKCAVLWRPAG